MGGTSAADGMPYAANERRQRVAVGVEDGLLVQRLRDALHTCTHHLGVGCRWIQHPPTAGHRNMPQWSHLAGICVHLDHREVGGCRVARICLLIDAAGASTGSAAVATSSLSVRALSGTPATPNPLALVVDDVGLGCLQQVGGKPGTAVPPPPRCCATPPYRPAAWCVSPSCRRCRHSYRCRPSTTRMSSAGTGSTDRTTLR